MLRAGLNTRLRPSRGRSLQSYCISKCCFNQVVTFETSVNGLVKTWKPQKAPTRLEKVSIKLRV